MKTLLLLLASALALSSAHAADRVGHKITLREPIPACVELYDSFVVQAREPMSANTIMRRMPLIDMGANIKAPPCTWLTPGDDLRVREDGGDEICVEYAPKYSAGDGKSLDPSNPFRRPCYWMPLKPVSLSPPAKPTQPLACLQSDGRGGTRSC
jgi:hypothetical protein